MKVCVSRTFSYILSQKYTSNSVLHTNNWDNSLKFIKYSVRSSSEASKNSVSRPIKGNRGSKWESLYSQMKLTLFGVLSPGHFRKAWNDLILVDLIGTPTIK